MGKRSIFRNILKVLIVRRMSEMCPVAQLVSVRFLYQLQVLSNFGEIHSHAENSEDTLLAKFACVSVRESDQLEEPFTTFVLLLRKVTTTHEEFKGKFNTMSVCDVLISSFITTIRDTSL